MKIKKLFKKTLAGTMLAIMTIASMNAMAQTEKWVWTSGFNAADSNSSGFTVDEMCEKVIEAEAKWRGNPKMSYNGTHYLYANMSIQCGVDNHPGVPSVGFTPNCPNKPITCWPGSHYNQELYDKGCFIHCLPAGHPGVQDLEVCKEPELDLCDPSQYADGQMPDYCCDPKQNPNAGTLEQCKPDRCDPNNYPEGDFPKDCCDPEVNPNAGSLEQCKEPEEPEDPDPCDSSLYPNGGVPDFCEPIENNPICEELYYDGVLGFVACDGDNNNYSCVWTNKLEFKNKTSEKIIQYCIRDHEQNHINTMDDYNATCGPSDPEAYSYGTFPNIVSISDPTKRYKSEMDAYYSEIDCVEARIDYCKDNETCAKEIADWVSDAYNINEKYNRCLTPGAICEFSN